MDDDFEVKVENRKSNKNIDKRPVVMTRIHSLQTNYTIYRQNFFKIFSIFWVEKRGGSGMLVGRQREKKKQTK